MARRGARRRSRVLVLAGAMVLVLAPMTLGSGPAGAQVTGGCSATIDGQDVGAARSARSAIEVDADDSVELVGTAPGPITGYEVALTFGPVTIPAGDGTVDDQDTTYRKTVEVSDYATYGVGLYRIEGRTTGTECTTWAYVKVTGKNPLTTVAGAVGATLAVGGAIGMATAVRPRKGVGA